MAVGLSKWGSLAALAVAEVLALALWFSASAVVPALKQEFGLDGFHASLFTSAVQAGFVVGTLLSAFLGLADRLDPRRYFTVAALIAGIANGAILLLPPTSPMVVVLRFITGMCMAGIYPVGMRLAATWAKGDLGLIVGLLVGALTLGSAAPHLFNALGGVDWRFTIGAASASAIVAALLVNLAGIGPNMARAPRFEARMVLKAWTTPALRLANLGYFGHMWELYAMWAWIVVFLDASFLIVLPGETAAFYAKLAAFATLAAGALGCLVAGIVADRYGRTTVTMAAMATSGACAIGIGFLFGADPWLVALVCVIWGFAVVADSAQFSASVAELSEPTLIGTMLTTQTCIGFLLTLFTIHMIPYLVEALTWRYAFAALAIGPFLGIWAMARLRAHPDAARLAGGRR